VELPGPGVFAILEDESYFALAEEPRIPPRQAEQPNLAGWALLEIAQLDRPVEEVLDRLELSIHGRTLDGLLQDEEFREMLIRKIVQRGESLSPVQ